MAQRLHSAEIANVYLQNEMAVPNLWKAGIWRSYVAQRLHSAEITSGSLQNETSVPNLKQPA